MAALFVTQGSESTSSILANHVSRLPPGQESTRTTSNPLASKEEGDCAVFHRLQQYSAFTSDDDGKPRSNCCRVFQTGLEGPTSPR